MIGHGNQGRSQEFLFGGPSSNTNIFIKTIPYTHINTHAIFLLYTQTFLFDKLYIYTHPTKKELNIFNQNYV